LDNKKQNDAFTLGPATLALAEDGADDDDEEVNDFFVDVAEEVERVDDE
jgi:hypothetical protein